MAHSIHQDAIPVELDPPSHWAHKAFLTHLSSKGFTSEECTMIDSAYDLAKNAHCSIARTGGERYFEHVRMVALILIDEAAVTDARVIVAALLHDTVEDTSIFGSLAVYSPDQLRMVAHQRIARYFDGATADMVLTLSKYHRAHGADADPKHADLYLRNLAAAPVETVLIKMADRLHNLRTVGVKNDSFQAKYLRETQGLLLPIFHRAAEQPGPYQSSCKPLIEKIIEATERLAQRLNPPPPIVH